MIIRTAIAGRGGATDIELLRFRPQPSLTRSAGLYEQVAERWTQYGHLLERGLGLLGAGRCLVRLNRPQAVPKLEDARTSFAALGARPLLAETDTWLLDAAAQNV